MVHPQTGQLLCEGDTQIQKILDSNIESICCGSNPPAGCVNFIQYCGRYQIAAGPVSMDTAVGDYITWIRGNSDYDPSGRFFGDPETTEILVIW